MALDYLSELSLKQFITFALAEDVADGDVTSLACIPSDAENTATLVMKADGIIAGINLAEKIFLHINPSIEFKANIRDGKEVKKGDVILTLKGNCRDILKGERIMLNCMQRMSAIATYTHFMVGLIKGTSAKLLDTRKTTPNFRMMEKWAVVIGGGNNHRYNLNDMVMIKDNHIDYAGGIKKAIFATQNYLEQKELKVKIEVEARDLGEVKEILDAGGVDRIMLDNMSNDDMKTAVEIIGDSAETEASGGITEETIRGVAETGVDFISVGALTHSVKSLDMSLIVE